MIDSETHNEDVSRSFDSILQRDRLSQHDNVSVSTSTQGHLALFEYLEEVEASTTGHSTVPTDIIASPAIGTYSIETSAISHDISGSGLSRVVSYRCV